MNSIQTRNKLFVACLNWYSSYGSTWFAHYIFKAIGKVETCRLPNALRQLWMTDSQSLQGRQTTTNMNANPKNSIIHRVTDHLNSEYIWHNHIHADTTSLRSSSLRTCYKDILSFMSFDPQEGSKPGHQIGNFLKVCISSDCFLLLRVLDLELVYKPKLPNRIAKLTQLRLQFWSWLGGGVA
ncbi:hypothetical protein KIW84_061454 [Lathyrus oleraceus]|uniref:Uncharacterized protein n=1 Tax=Pisum sativum TaxID=3888 RepID=A0A9D5A583_PEA|nr:hypothetical protein KIW84_061454 [Pisum sativum]